jgi:tetratricopeptide (TPR) repeat protein
MRVTILRFLFGLLIISAVYSCKQKTEIAIQNPPGIVNVESLISQGKKHINAQIELLPYADSLLKIAQNTNNKRALVYGEQFKADYYWLTADHQRSMKLAIKCVADAEKWNIKDALPEIYLIIGNLHKENTNYKMAFESQEKGLYWASANHDTASIIMLLGLKAMFIHTYRTQPHDKPYKDTSINIQLATLKLAESNIKYERLCIPLYDNISQYYLNKGDYKNAIYYGEKGALTAIKYNQQRSLTYSYSWLGEAWYFKGDKQKGLDYLNRALQISRTLKEPYREMELYEHEFDCYYSSGDYKTAIAFSSRSHKMRDSLQVSINEKQISELQIKYESVKKDKAIAQMDHTQRVRNKEIIISLAGSLLFIIFFVILFLQYRILHQSNHAVKKSNALKDKALEDIAHIQSHELRKPLASIMGLINLIKAMDYELDKESILKLEEASKQLDERIRSIINHVENENK